MKPIYFFLASFLLFFSCKKKEGANQNLDPDKQERSNYMSTKEGSWWLFASKDNLTIKRIATGKDSIKKGLLFSYFEKWDITDYPANEPEITPEYFGKNENKYVSLLSFDETQTNYVTLVFLLDSAKKGDSWENTEDYTYNNIKMNLYVKSSVAFIDGSLELGKLGTINDVTKVHHELKGKTNFMATYTNVGTLDIWFAKGIGIVKQDMNVDIKLFGSSIVSRQYADSLIDYHIVE